MTVFADRIFPVPMGIAVEEHYDKDGKYTGCRVFIGNSPDLLVLEDTDGDDKADKRYPLLTGFGGVDSDHGVHGMVLGIDGKLYFSSRRRLLLGAARPYERPQNFDVIDKGGRHVWTDQLANTLRVNRDGTQFEIICDRQRNNYETSLNSFGNIFTSDNDDDGNRGCRVIWAMDGGHYGYHTPGSPRHWGEEVPGNVPKLVGTGNGSPCGIMVYEGELLPNEYRGGVLEVDAGTRQVNFFPLSRKGAAFRTEYKVFVAGDDPWFRPVDACAAPDGSVFVADWYDAGVGGHAFSDQTTGRIYRVAPRGTRARRSRSISPHRDGLIAALNRRTSPPRTWHGEACSSKAKKQSSYTMLAIWQSTAETRFTGLAVSGFGMRSRGTQSRRPLSPRLLTREIRASENKPCGFSAATVGRMATSNTRNPRPGSSPPRWHISTSCSPWSPTPMRVFAASWFWPCVTFRPTRSVMVCGSWPQSWDGQDRWYLEALGLALENRESDFLSKLFDGTLFGELDLDQSRQERQCRAPAVFPGRSQ